MPSPVVEEGEGEDKVRVPKRKQEPADVTGPEVDTDSDHKDDFVSLSSYESDVNSYHTAPEFPDGTSRPHFRIRPKKALVKEGGSALLECVVGGIPVPGVTWLYKNEPVRPSDSLRIEGEGETSQLVFPKVSLDQGGLYTAKASNLNGSILSSADLVVLQDFDEETVQPAENGVTAESAKETQEAASTAEAVEKAEAPKLEEPSKPTKKEPEDKKPKEEDKKEKDKKAEEAEKAETKTKPKEPEAVVKDQVDAPVKEEVLQKAEVAPEEKPPKAEEKPKKEEEKPVAEEKVKPETAPEAKEEPVAKKEAEKEEKKKEDKKPEEVKEQPKEEKAPEKKKEEPKKAEEPAKKATEEEKPADKKEKPEGKPKASEPKEDSLSATEVKAEAKPETKADSKTLESAEKTKPAQKEKEPVEAKSVEPKEDTLSSEEKQLEAKPRPEADTKTLESAKTTKPEEKKAAAEEEKEGKAPVIMGSMADITLEPGRLARFDCRIVAYPEPTITWLKDGKAVRHCDHTQLINCDGEVYSLLIRDVTKDDNGLYTCLAVNKFGEAKSEALLNVIDLQKLEDDEDTAPSFVTRFYDVEVLENVPADFQCLIKGRPFPKVQWLLNGRELKEGPELMLWQEGNQARMAIRHAKLEQSGEVICRISNDLGEATCSAQLVVVEDMSKFHAAPVFVKEPHDVEVDAGEDVTFECVIQGLPVPEVTWHFRARELFESKRRIMESDGDTHRLTLRDVVSDNSGEYVIKASNIIGDATCRVRLTVNKPRESLADIGAAEVPGSKYGYAPSFTRRLQDLRGAPGSMATMECRVIGVPDPIVTWEKDGKTLVGNDRVQVSADSSNPSVTILSLEPDDTGEYTCLVSNDAGKSSCTGRLRVQAEKARPRYSPDKELIEEYAPPAKVPLKILDEGIPEMPQDKPVLMDIRPDSVRLKWLSARIPESDKAGPVRYVVEGRALPDSRWLRMETGIPSTAQVIRGLKPDREYDFRIRAETKLGSSQPTLPATLEKREPRKKAEEIKAPPVLPSYQPYITDMGPETVRLAWKPAESPVTRTEMPGVSYRLETQRLPSEDWVPMATRLRSPSYYIPDLPPDRDYMMRVRAENEYGLSEPTAPIWLPRAKAFPGVPVGRPRIIEMGDDMVKLSWTRVDVPATQADEEPLLYMIEMQEPPSHVWRTIAERVPKENYLITDLQPGTDYRFRVRSQTPDGRISEPSPATSIFRTLATTRVPVDDLTVEQYEPEDEAVTLSWQRVRVPPFHRDEDTLLFMLEYQEPAIGEWRPLASGLPTTRYRVPDIGPTQDYRFRVRGLSPHGVSPPSYPAGLYRSVSPMRPIAERLEISDLEPESLRLSWRPSPARSTEPLTYLIEGRELPSMEWRPLARDVADTSYRLGGLRSSADYAFRVAPTSAAIAGLEPSPPVSLTSLPVVPRLPASSLTLRESGPDSVDLHWQPANLGVYSRRDVPIFYTVEQCEVPGAWTTVARRVPKTSYSVTGLRPDRDYRFRVRPDTDFGSGDFTLPVMLHRHIAGSLPQREPIISDVTGDSLLLTWEPVRFPRGGDADVSYNVEMLEPPGSYWLPICTGLRTTSYRVRHLNPDRDYMFRVVAVSDRVDPSPTPAAYLARRAGPPKLPREAPFVSDLQPDSLTLNWRAVDIPSRITDYSPVTYRIEILDSPLHAWRTLAQGITRTQHHITGLAPDMDFSFRIRAENEFGLSEPTDILLVRRRAVPPIMPQEEPMITDVRPGSLRLSWRPAECPSFIRDYVPITYSILVQEPPDSSWQPLVRRVPTTSYHVTGLDPDKTYLFRVVADNEYGTSTPTPYVQLRRMPDFRAPVLLPEIEDVEPTGGLRLSWRPKAELPKPSHYSLETYEPLERTWRPLATKIPDTRYRLTDLAPSRDYLFRVRPELDTGPAEPSYPLLYSRHRVAPKVPVERPQLWDISPDSVRISWLPVRLSAYDRPPTSIRYQLEQRDLPHGSWTVVAPRVLDHSYFLHGLKPSLDYAFRVRIVDDDGVSEPSIPVYLYRRPGEPPEVIPSLPLERPRIESLDDEAVRLRWNRVSVPPFDVDEDDLTFMIEAQRLPEQDWRPLARGIRDTQHRISGLTPGHNYHFRVRGESSIGLTMPSTYIPYYRRPLRANVPITYPSIEDVDTSSARLRWRPVYIPPYVSPSTTYSVEVQEPPRRDWRSLASDVPGYDYLVSDLAPRRDYLFRIRARSPAGDYSEPTAPIPYYKGHLLRYESLPVVSMRPLALEAFTPTRIYIDTLTVRVPPHLPMEKPEMMEVNPQSVRLAWKPARVSAATASLSPVTYKIEARVGPSLDWEELASGLVGQGHMLTDLNPHLDYCFRVRAVNEFGDSEPTMPVYLYRKREYDFEFFDGEGEEFFFGPEIPSALPKMPMDTPKLLDVTGDSLTLRWKPGRIPLYAEKVPITYTVEMCEAPSASWKTLASGIASTQHQVTGLNPESDYSFRVRAISMHGSSESTIPATLLRHPRASSTPRGSSISRMSSERDAFPQLPKTPYVNVISSGVPPRVPHGRPLISAQKEDSLMLSWNPARLPSYMKPTPITYSVEVKEPPGYLWSLLADKVKDTKYLVTDLRPEQDYMFRIRAENEFGRSEPTLPASLLRVREEPKPEPRRSVSRDRSMTPRRLLQRFASVERSMEKEKEQEELVGHTPETSPSQPEFLAVSSDSMFGAEGQPVKISLRVRGYPPPRVSWYVKGEKADIGDRYDSYITPSGQVVLEFESMTWDDVGEYKAYAENEHGTASKVINLLMADPPTFVEPLKDLVLVYQQSGKLEARVDGLPYPTIRWTKDWRPVGQTSRVTTEHDGDYWALSIEDAIPTDEGLYACVAENVAGKALCSARVSVEDKHFSKADMTFKDSSIEDYYYILEELGRGRHGVVRRLIEKTTGHEFVGKFVRVRSEADKDFFKCELESLRLVNHKNVLHVEDAYETPKRLITVSELVSGEELLERAVAADSWTESDMTYFVHQLLEALSHLHQCGVAHLDIKPSNILLTKHDSDEIKLIDFGFARKLPVARDFRFNYGSPEVASPEAVKDESVTMASDMWSVGVLTYILLSGLSPFRGASVSETLRKVKDADWKFDDKVFADVSKEAKDFISKLLVLKPDSRLTVQQCLEHPWIKMAVKRGQGLKINTARLRQYLATSRAERAENAVRVAAQLRSLRSLMEGVASEAGLLPITDAESGQVIFPDSEAYGEFLDDETWYDWQSRYQFGPDTQLLPLHEADYTARVRGYRRSMSRSLPPDPQATMKERRLMSDIDKEELPPSLEKEMEFLSRKKEEPDSKRSSICSAIGEPGVPGPIFHEHLRDIAFVPGETVILYCQVAGDPPPTVAWYRNEELLTDGPRVKTYLGDNGVATLTLSSAKPYDIGVYKCVARSKTGRSSSRARILMGDVPDRPGRPVVAQVSSEEALVIWDAPRPRKRGNSDILYYKVDYKKNGDARWTTGCCVPLESALVGGLSPNSPYRFRVCCVNKFGPGAYSWSSVEIHTRPAGCPPLKADGDRDLELLRARQMDLKAILKAAEETEEEEELPTGPAPLLESSPEKEYELGDVLLKGHFSELRQCKKPSINQTFTVKVTPLTSARKEEAMHEFDILRDLRHDRIIRVIEGYKMADTLYLICEKLCGDHVVRHLSLRRKYSEECVARIVRQLLAALQWLQHLNIVHLNLQPSSVLMESHSSYSLRLADFSHAIRIPPDAEGESVQRAPRRGYPDFIPPEVVGHERVSFAADVWGVGNLAFLLLSGQTAYGGVTDEDTLANVAYNRYDAHALYENATTDAVKFIFKVMKRLPRNRPSLQYCLEHKWLQYTDHSVKTREDTIFLSNKLRAFANLYDKRRLSPDFKDDFQTFVPPKAAVLKPAQTSDVSAAAPADVTTPTADVSTIPEVSEAPPVAEAAQPEVAPAVDAGKAEAEVERVADDVVAKAMDEALQDAAEKA